MFDRVLMLTLHGYILRRGALLHASAEDQACTMEPVAELVWRILARKQILGAAGTDESPSRYVQEGTCNNLFAFVEG